jgi:uncharacterized protein with HEPN domain
MHKSNEVYLQDIRDALEEIRIIIGTRSAEEVLEDHGNYYGILYLLMVIGEASGSLSEEFRLRHPDIPWIKVRGMRNILIHEYEGVSFDIVWKTIQERLPELKRVVEKAIAEGEK